jgi:hypothetical protein
MIAGGVSVFMAVVCLIAFAVTYFASREMHDATTSRTRKCPECAEMIQPDARKCRYCGAEISSVAMSTKKMVDIADIMDEPEPPAAEIRELRRVLREFTSVDPQTILRPDLGELNFSELKSTFEELVGVLTHLLAMPLENLPPHIAKNATAKIQGLRNHYKTIQKFSIKTVHSGNAVTARNSAANTFVAEVRGVVAYLMPIAGYLGSFGERDESKRLELIVSKAEERTKHIRQLESAMETIVDAARKASGELSVGKHAQHFANAAHAHGESASRWLKTTAGAGALTLGLAAYQWMIVWQHDKPLSPGQSAQLIFAKALVFSVAISATLWCGKVYRALRHNEIVNRHRANALSSFEALAESTDDAATKNAVLIQATTSIFAPQPSGFSTSDADTAGPSQLIELVRNVGPKQ